MTDERTPAWYVSTGQYTGRGSINALGLNKEIEGTFQIDWDDLGRCDITCNPFHIDSRDLMELMNQFDRFSDFKVETEEGVFTSPKLFFSGITFGTAPTEIRFTTLKAIYVKRARSEPSHWNAPILNLITHFRAHRTALEHPLRIQPPASVVVETDSAFQAGLRQAESSRLCLFQFAGALAFIERLPSFEDRKNKLAAKTSNFEVTCMMVGSLPENTALDLNEILEWFPANALTALSLASGTSVGFGFVELRDTSANLCARVHTSFHCDPYLDNPIVIGDLEHDGGLGGVIAAFIDLKGEALRRATVLAQMIKIAKSQITTPDHAFSTIVRVLDGTSNALDLNRRRLLLEVPEQERDAIRSVLTSGRKELLLIAKKMEAHGVGVPESATVRRIASRLYDADAIEDSFGLTLPRLLKLYSLNDEQALAELYLSDPRFDGSSWPEALNKYRGQVIHQGYIDYRAGIPISDVVAVTRHLIDVATRICLKEAGYTGTYNPFNLTAMQDLSLDYFQTKEDAALFGLNGKNPNIFNRG